MSTRRTNIRTLKNIPLDAFLEAAFVLEYGFADEEGFGVTVDVGAGARYYF